MTRIHVLAFVTLAFTATACADNKTDYDALRKCEGLGNKPGTVEYDRCVRDEKSVRMMDEQRREFEKMKQDDRDRKLRGY